MNWVFTRIIRTRLFPFLTNSLHSLPNVHIPIFNELAIVGKEGENGWIGRYEFAIWGFITNLLSEMLMSISYQIIFWCNSKSFFWNLWEKWEKLNWFEMKAGQMCVVSPLNGLNGFCFCDQNWLTHSKCSFTFRITSMCLNNSVISCGNSFIIVEILKTSVFHYDGRRSNLIKSF